MSQLYTCSCNLVEKAFATDDYMPFFPLASYFYDIFAWPCTNLHLWALCFFFFFLFRRGALLFLLFLSFCYCCCPSTSLASSLKIPEKLSIIKAGGSYHGVAKGNFAPSFSLKFPAELDYEECQFCSKEMK